MYNNGYWPKSWKNAIVTPLLKSNKPPTSCDSYRPISMLPCIFKVYQTFILKKLKNHSSDNEIVPDIQFGFKERHSTLHALSIFYHDITTELNKKTPTIACSLDCAKAFDTTWTDGLLYKLRFLFGIHPHLCNIIQSFLRDRTYQVKVDDTLSEKFKMAAGTPQGVPSLLPFIYILYIADLPPPQIPTIKRICYADDILVYHSSKDTRSQALNTYLNELHNYLTLWKIKLNINKCAGIIIKGQFFQNITKVDNQLLHHYREINNTDCHLNTNNTFKTPFHLQSLLLSEQTFNNNNQLIYYHRRYNNNRNNIIYNTNQ